MVSLNTMTQLAESDFTQSSALCETEEGGIQDATIDGMQVMQPGEGLDVATTTDVRSSDFPNNNCCYLYSEVDFYGSRREFCHQGEHDEIYILKHYGFDYTTKSFKCGKTTKITLCNGEWDRGVCENYSQNYISSSSGHMAVHSLGQHMRNQVSSIQLKPYNYREHGAVTVFAARNCWGYSASFEYTGNNGQVRTTYQKQDLWDRGIGNNWISSVMVPEGYIAELYERDSQQGHVEIQNGHYIDENKRMVCRNINQNNLTDSLVIRPYSQGSALGTWEPLAVTTETIVFEKTVGMTAVNTETVTEAQKRIMTASMTLGLDFEGLDSAKFGMKHKYEEGIINAVKRSYTQISSEKVTTTCTVPEGESGAGLWQWVVSTGDYSITSRHLLSICKTGEGFNHPPRCPISACIDGACETCTDDWMA